MITEQQVAADAESLVNDLVSELNIRSIARKDQEQVLMDAAKVLAMASKVLARMIADKCKMTMH